MCGLNIGVWIGGALRAGQVQIGCWLNLSTHITVEVMTKTGFDWLLAIMPMVTPSWSAIPCSNQRTASSRFPRLR